ncbi:acyl-CoA dehydrogenase [Rhodococcus sp. WS4]|nr:acyl-CoA dehydrogenase [Rhodococcus sp. WS4]
MTLSEFREQAGEWLRENVGAVAGTTERDPFDVAVFHSLPFEAEQALLEEHKRWQRIKFDAGYGALDWSVEDGGAGLSVEHADVFARDEAALLPLAPHELFSVTMHLIAPTIRILGTPRQKETFLPSMLRGELLACQLFSEPGAGSDLASLGTRAVRDGDEWVINGQKVWTSGAQFAEWGELIARTDPDVPKHAGMTAFLVPLDAPGVEVRQIRQMSGGTSFNEVFFTDVRVPDRLRLGEVGAGWNVALTTLAFERGGSSNTAGVGGQFSQLVASARAAGRIGDPQIRQQLAEVYLRQTLAEIDLLRDRQARAAGGAPGAVGSVRKVQWVDKLKLVSDTATAILGRTLLADTGRPGTYAWNEHVLGAPGYRIAGGSDEIQRNIIAERLLGLPAEARADKGKSWRESTSRSRA